MNFCFIKKFVYFILVSFFLILMSCTGSKKNILLDSKDIQRKLYKQAGIAIFKNKTVYNKNNYLDTLYKTIASTVQKISENQIMTFRSDTTEPIIIKNIPRLISGYTIDNQALTKKGRELGLNAIITGELYSIELIEEKRGIIGFRKFKPFINIKSTLSVYDCETGAKLLFEYIDEKILLDDKYFLENNIKDDILTKIKENDSNKSLIDISLYEDLINSIFKKIGNKYGELSGQAINIQPWKAFIVDKKEPFYIISAGERSNIKKGDIFEVYGKYKIINGIGGQSYIIPGPGIGKIKIHELTYNSAKGVPLIGHNFDISCCIQKQKTE